MGIESSKPLPLKRKIPNNLVNTTKEDNLSQQSDQKIVDPKIIDLTRYDEPSPKMRIVDYFSLTEQPETEKPIVVKISTSTQTEEVVEQVKPLRSDRSEKHPESKELINKATQINIDHAEKIQVKNDETEAQEDNKEELSSEDKKLFVEKLERGYKYLVNVEGVDTEEEFIEFADKAKQIYCKIQEFSELDEERKFVCKVSKHSKFNAYTTDLIYSEDLVEFKDVLKRLERLNTKYKYNLVKSEMKALAEEAVREIVEKRKSYRMHVLEKKWQKYTTDIVEVDEKDAELQEKLKQNDEAAKKSMKKLKTRLYK